MRGSNRKTSTSALLTMPKPLTVWIARVQPPQDPGEPEGKMALADDLERDKEIL